MYMNIVQHYVKYNATGFIPSNRFNPHENYQLVKSNPYYLTPSMKRMISNNFFINLFRKLPGTADHDLTMQIFLDREEKNRKINISLRNSVLKGDLGKVVSRWSHEVHKILHEDPLPVGSLTMGATTHSKKGHGAFDRFLNAGITSDLENFLATQPVIDCDVPWIKTVSDIGSDCRIIDKDGIKGRLIHPEPACNMFYQRGYGLQLSSLYAKAGRNIPDLPARHVELARQSSIDLSLCTIDLSGGNLNLPTELVRLVLPQEWFVHLDAARSKVTTYNGCAISLETFTTAGNGFCFELESILFYALVRAICYLRGHKGIVSVYGDDIICPDSAYKDVASCMGALGFDINHEKSFHGDVPFRESCGGDFFRGYPVRPVFCRTLLEDIGDVITLHNQCWERFSGLSQVKSIRDFQIFLRSIIFANSDYDFGPSHVPGCVHSDFFFNETPKRLLCRVKGPSSKMNLGKQVAGTGRRGRELYFKLSMQSYLQGLGGHVVKHKLPKNLHGPIQQTWQHLPFKTGEAVYGDVRSYRCSSLVDENSPLSVFNLGSIPVRIKYASPSRFAEQDKASHAYQSRVSDLSLIHI